MTAKSSIAPLKPSALYRRCDPSSLPMETTEDLESLREPFAQARAVEATRFAVSMAHDGYNLFVIGPSGVGKHAHIQQLLSEAAASQPTPPDWCYVHHFARPHTPTAIDLPAGRGRTLVADMRKLVQDLRAAIPTAFQAEEYRTRLQEIEEEFKERHERVFRAIQEEAEKDGIALIRMPTGVVFAPVKDGEVIGPDKFEALPKKEQERAKSRVVELQEKLQAGLRDVPQWGKETRDKVRALDQEVTRFAVGHTIDELRSKYEAFPKVLAYLDAVHEDVVENADDFRSEEEAPGVLPGLSGGRRFERYEVNLLVDRTDERGAPVLYEDRPGCERLLGRVEHRSLLGSLVSDFTLIQGGALHKANGGYLIVDARKILTEPYAWEALKRALFSHRVRPESLGALLGVSSTATLEPEPIPLDVKVVLVADRLLYYLLAEHDSEVRELFKVVADFAEQIDRNAESDLLYARLIATRAREQGTRPFHRDAVARVIEFSARTAGYSGKLSADIRGLSDLIKEADHFAGLRQADVVSVDDVSTAIDTRIRRHDRFRERTSEAILDGTVLIDTSGARVGQVNGLAVLALPDAAFGRPTRITATVRIGGGKVVDVEREVELGGAVHSKGVLILSNYLASRYARKYPLSLSASLVFEQSYSGIEGDSASLAELCALLSALANLPISQAIAVTGSVNQLGKIQAIGGVNEKIEGFFEICVARGLSGDQGVVIPTTNVRNLMLRSEVVDAVREGKFNVYAVDTVDEAIEILTGVPAGARDEDGQFPEGSVNGLAERQLMEFAVIAEGFGKLVRIEEEAPPDAD